MKISLPVKALSVNDAYRGRRFKSKKLIQYQHDCTWLLRNTREKVYGEVELNYKFYLKHYRRTDVGNLEKTITDILVECGVISDDMYVVKITLEKFKSTKDFILVEISKYSNNP